MKLLKISFTVPLSKVCVNLLINVEINVKFDLVTVHIHATVIRIMAIKGVSLQLFQKQRAIKCKLPETCVFKPVISTLSRLRR